jgi:hypothetical protein
MARAADFDLARELAKPSFTPAQRDAPALVELVVAGVDPSADHAATALAALGDAGRKAIDARLAGRTPEDGEDTELGDGATARLVGALGLAARRGDAQARAAVLARTNDPAARVRRAAIGALGKLGGDDARGALLARWDASDVPPDERRALAEALGKLGGDDAIARLTALDPGDDAELARRRDRALLMAERTARRGDDSSIAIDLAPPSPLAIALRCRAGLAHLLVEELGMRGIAGTALRDDVVHLQLAGPWSTLHASRLWASAAIRVPLASDDVDAIASAIVSPPVRALLGAWTKGPIRWRLGFEHGRKRAVVWNVAKAVTVRAPELINDPTQTTWDINVVERALEIVPRRAPDPRFDWRVAEVPAASHPTVAAALAFVAGARNGDRVWDPFCGSGAELVERARLGPYDALSGSDLDEAALAAARENLAAAGATATLVHADARTHAPGPMDLIITNPPLGSRVQVDAAALLVAALPNLARQLAANGRLVWITPASRKTTPVAEQLGLRRTKFYAVDLGGVRGHLERWDRS